MSSSHLETLRDAIRDESLSMTDRRIAAERYIAELVDAVPEPGDDHTEVIARMTPPKADGLLGDLYKRAWELENETMGWHRDGPTVAQARRWVHERLRFRALLAVVVDETAHKLERLEACQRVLDHLHQQSVGRSVGRNTAPTAEQMLAKVLPANGMKWGSWREGKVPVERPPQTFTDVWY